VQHLKKHSLIFIFCFLVVFFKAQNRINFPLFDSRYSKSDLKLSFTQYSILLPCSNYNIYLTARAPQLPFFCDMEEKFRSKFSFFLKLRVGNDESYMRMITPNNRE